MGNGRRLKEALGDAVKIVAAEPMQGEPVQGLRSLDDGFIPPIIDLSLLDRKIFVTNSDAIVWTRKLLDEEGIFAGVSSGAIARVAVRIAGELDEGNVVFIVADDGWKYLSSGALHAAARGDREPREHALVVGDSAFAESSLLACAGWPGRALKISRALYDEMVAHALAEAPNECCGIVASAGRRGASRVYRRDNIAREPAALRDGRRRPGTGIQDEIEAAALGLRRDLPLAHAQRPATRRRPTSTWPTSPTSGRCGRDRSTSSSASRASSPRCAAFADRVETRVEEVALSVV